MSIVDVYDALTSKRPYKEPYSHEKAVAIIAEASGKQFDPALVEEFMRISSRIKTCLEAKEKMIKDQQFFVVDKEKYRVQSEE